MNEHGTIRPWNSLRWRFSALLVALIAASGLLQLFFSTRGWRELVEHLEQQVNWNLAGDIAEKIEPFTKNSLDREAVGRLLLTLTISNPRAEFVLLDAQGRVVTAIPYHQGIEREVVSLEPLKRALEPISPSLPLYGDDPFDRYGRKIFSVARLDIENQAGYLYVPLMSSAYDFLLRNTGQFYLAKIIALGLFLSWLFALAAGFLLFYFLSRRFRSITQAIVRFQNGELAARAPIGRDDELGRLALSFNSMAETIAGNTEELKRKDQLRRNLIANISHDLRGPVTSTLAHLEVMMEKPLSTDEQTQYLEVLHENAFSQKRLVEDLFDLSVLEANEERLNRDFCSFKRIAGSVLAAAAPMAEKKSQTLVSSVSDHLPSVFADSRALQRILSNLVTNAIRYTPNGGRIELAAEIRSEGKPVVAVSISDTGIGIPADELPFIFDSFYRANTSRPENPGGTGLGLSIVKRLLALHGSEPQVVSAVDRGTTISFDLPTSDDGESTA